MRRTSWVVAAAVVSLAGVPASAQSPAPKGAAAGAAAVAKPAAGAKPASALDGAALYKEKTCVACHGKDANTPLLPEYPKLAGQNEAYLVRQIQDIKSGARNNGNTAAMQGVLHLVNDDEIKAISAYLAGLK